MQSITAKMIAHFAPKSLLPDIRQPIERLLDVRSESFYGVLSPDGKRYFFTWEVTGSHQIWRLDGPNTCPVQLTAGRDTNLVRAITPDGRTIIFSRDRNGEENSGLYIMPADGGPVIVVQHLPDVQTNYQGISPNSRSMYFTANDRNPDSYTIYRYDFATRQRSLVCNQPGLWTVADIAESGTLLLTRETGNMSSEYFFYTPETKELMPLFGQRETVSYAALFGRTDHELIVQTNKFSNFSRLYRFERGTFMPFSPEVPYDVDTFHIPQNRSRVVYTLNQKGYFRTRVMDITMRREISGPILPAEVELATAQSSTPDGRYTVYRFDWARSPATTAVYDWATKKLTPWLRPSLPEVDSTRFAHAELIEIPMRDGTNIPAFVRRPADWNRRFKPCPVIVNFHGGPEAQALPGFDRHAQVFVDAGYIYLEPNIRGSSGYGKAYVEADNGPRRLQVITDIEDVALYLKKNLAIHGEAPKLGVLGASYGGYAALLAMTRFAGAYDVGVSIVGISNLISFLQNTAPYRRSLRIAEYGDPQKDRNALLELSPITHVAKLKGPLLLIQGANDPRVPVGEALQMYEAAKTQGVPTELIIFPDEGHGMRLRANEVLAFGHTLRWFQVHLV